MTKIIIGVVLGVLVYHYYPSEVVGFAEKTGEIVHEGASKAVELTKPKTTLEKIEESLK
jgi:hypothetical protein